MEAGREVLSAFEKVLPFFGEFFDDEVSLALTDHEKFLLNLPCKSIPVEVKFNTPIPEKGAASEVLKKKTRIIKEVGKEVYGVAFKSYGVPVFEEDGTLSGCVLLARSLERTEKVKQMSVNLRENIALTNSKLQQFLLDIQMISEKNSEIEKETRYTVEATKGTKEIIKFIQGISGKTKLLGLNASIEAARAGESGRGFMVVANEIGKMATSTSESLKKINDILESMSISIDEIHKKVENYYGIFRGEIEEINQIATSINEIRNDVMQLEEFSRNF